MPGLTLSFFAIVAAATHAAAAIAIGDYLCGGNDDDSNYSSSSHRRTTRIQTQPSYTPPPRSPSYTHRPPETYTRTTSRTPAPPDPGHGVYHPRIVSPYTRTPSQTQPSSTSTRPSNVQYASTRSLVPPRVPTERDPLLCTVIHGVPRSDVATVASSNRTPDQTPPPSTRIRPSCAHTQPSSTRIQPPSTPTHPSSSQIHPSSTRAQPSIRVVRFASTSSHVPSCVPTEREHLPPTAVSGIHHSSVVSLHTPTQLSSTATQPSPTPTKASYQHSSILNTVHINETSFHVPLCVDTGSKPPPTAVQAISPDLRSDEPIVEDFDFAEELRVKARRRWEEMTEARKRAKSARKKRYGGGAQAHNREAAVHEKAVKELNKRAAKIIFTENNKVCS
jgi:hypothetical protein